jgi:hypothetical protein
MYRDIYFLSRDKEQLFHNLLDQQPCIAKFIRSYRGRDWYLVERLLLLPVKLDFLFLPTAHGDPDAFVHPALSINRPVILIESYLRDLHIRNIHLEIGKDDDKWPLSVMHVFKGLESLTLHISDSSPNLDRFDILPHLNCPNLKHLHLAGFDCRMFGGLIVPHLKAFPKLEALYLRSPNTTFYRRMVLSRSQEVWDALVTMKDKNVLFYVGMSFAVCERELHWYIYQCILEIARSDESHHDVAPLVEWLTLSAAHFLGLPGRAPLFVRIDPPRVLLNEKEFKYLQTVFQALNCPQFLSNFTSNPDSVFSDLNL